MPDIFNNYNLTDDSDYSENKGLTIIELDRDDEELSSYDGDIVKRKMFAELTEFSLPLIPIPSNSYLDIEYAYFKVQKNCTLCKAPESLRKLAEHIYIGNAQKPHTVVRFFERHFNARITDECVGTHMNKHCNLNDILRNFKHDLEVNAPMLDSVKFRELDFALNTLTLQLDRIMSENVKGLDGKLKQTDRVEKMVNGILKIQKQRDDSMVNSINPINILTKLIEAMHCNEDRIVLIDEAKRIKKQFLQGG